MPNFEAWYNQSVSEDEANIDIARMRNLTMISSAYKPETPLEEEMVKAIKMITTIEGRKQPSFVRIQLQFPKAHRAFQTIKKVFQNIDIDNDNTLSLPEINKAVKVLGGTTTEEEVKVLFETADADGSKCLDFKEFVVFLCIFSLVGKIDGSSEKDDCNINTAFMCAVDAFSVFDVNNSSIIVFSELREKMDKTAGKDVMLARMQEMDKDGDGYVTFPEFLFAFMSWVGSDDDDDDEE